MVKDTSSKPGASADKPTDIPAPGWKQIATRAWKEASADNVSLLSAGVAFYAFLAFVPLLGAMVLTYGLVAEPSTVVQHMKALTQAMPADAAGIITDQLKSVVQTSGSKKGLGLLIAIAVALYGATKGATSVMTATNITWDVEETRGFIKRTVLALLFTAGAMVGLLLAIMGVSVLGFVEHLLPSSSPVLHTVLKIAFWIPVAALISLGIAILYRYAPNRRPTPPWRWLSPGSIAATVVWLIATVAFGIYVANFGKYNATYGSLGAVIVFLTWLYLSAYILLLGAELNAELERQTDQAEQKERQRKEKQEEVRPSTWVPGPAA